jgi:RNA polymerase sigma-70 factor (ECF subfamily)
MADLEPDDTAPVDAELVERARRRDTKAFRELVDRYQDRAFGLAMRMLRSAVDAEEVTQDAFVRAWVALPSFRGDAAFGTWLHAIVARRALDRAATMRRRREREAPLEDAVEPTAPGGTDGEQARRSLKIERLLGGLGDARRAVIALYYWEQYPVDEIARMLGMPTGTVKTHLSRARAALREGWLKERTDR